MEKIEFSQVAELFESVRNKFSEKKDELCDMDARLGDGDLGLTMSKGFGALPDIIRAEEESAGGDVGKLIMKAGMKMSSLIPSTMGFLMSSGIMEGGKALKGRTEIDAQALADYIEGFAAGALPERREEHGEEADAEKERWQEEARATATAAHILQAGTAGHRHRRGARAGSASTGAGPGLAGAGSRGCRSFGRLRAGGAGFQPSRGAGPARTARAGAGGDRHEGTGALLLVCFQGAAEADAAGMAVHHGPGVA